MKFVYNQRLKKEVEGYCKILDDLVVLPLKTEMRYSISKEEFLSRKQYEERKNEIENQILQLFDKVNAVDKLCLALFVFRSVIKLKMYDDNFRDWTPRFKICNYLFFLSLQYVEKSRRTIYVSFNDRLVVKEIFFIAYTVFENQRLFNEQSFSGNQESINKYFDCVDKICDRRGDLHSYQVKNNDLNRYLNMKNLNMDKIKECALKKYKEKFIFKSQLENNELWEKMTLVDNLSEHEDDIVIVPTYIFNKYDEEFRYFINSFEVKKSRKPSDWESELIFAYQTENYVYISKRILKSTQIFIEDIITFGQYENVMEYFFGTSINQKTLHDYNRLMTYKIADLLLVNGYTLPMDKVNGLRVPRIEISNYIVAKEMENKLGDIDLIFYSRYTKVLYLVEYKNYQMMVSRDGDLSSEESKVKREKTPERVIRRHKYVCDNLEVCIERLFKSEIEVLEIKSIILTTKPCYYFYIYNSEEYQYFEWVEFESKVLENNF